MRYQARTWVVVLALVAQFALTSALVEGWFGKYNVVGGGCGWDGSCVDEGDGPLLIGDWLGVPAAEVGLAVVVSWLAVLVRRGEHTDQQLSWTLIARNIRKAILVGAGFSFVLVVQNVIIDRVTSGCAANQEAASAALFLRASGVAAGVDIALGLGVWPAVRYLRRRRPRTKMS